MENKLIVIYVGVAGIRQEDIETTVNKIVKRISPQTVDAEIIVIPRQSYDTQIECIDPVYITEEELIKKHTTLLKELHEELDHQLEEIKRDNDEKN